MGFFWDLWDFLRYFRKVYEIFLSDLPLGVKYAIGLAHKKEFKSR